jgi:hypothetical protein
VNPHVSTVIAAARQADPEHAADDSLERTARRVRVLRAARWA